RSFAHSQTLFPTASAQPFAVARRDPLLVKTMHIRCDFIETVFYGEMAGIEPVHLCARKIFEVCLAPLPREEDVVLSPENYRFRLALSEKTLPLWVEFNVCTVIVKKIHLYATGVGPLHESKIHVPVIWAD